MPWQNTPETRRQSDATYSTPEYRRNKSLVRRRSGGHCEWVEAGRRCNSTDRVQCDHRVPVSQGGTHTVTNLWDLCRTHHNRKTAQEGGGYRKQQAIAPDPSPRPATTW